MSVTGPLKRLSHRTLLFVAVAAITCAVKAPGVDQVDGAFRIQLAENVLHGELSMEPDPDWPMFFRAGQDGRTYSIYGLGQPLVLAPMVLVTGASPETPVSRAALVWLYTISINLALAGAIYGVFRQIGLTARGAGLSTLALMVVTPWLIWGHSLQEEALVGAALAGALYCTMRRLKSDGEVWAAVAGLLAAFTANARPNAVFIAGALFVWLVCCTGRGRFRTAAVFLAGSLPSLALFFWWNLHRFGNPLQTGWQTGNDAWSFQFDLFLNLLILPDFGLLWFAPLLLVLPAARGRARLRLLAWLVLLGFVMHAVLLAGYPRYVGHALGAAWGPRYMMHGVLFVAPLVWLGWLRVRRSRFRALAFVLLVGSTTIQWAGIMFPPRLEHAQDEFRRERSLGPMEPYAWLPRRFTNLYWWATGDLEDRSFPNDPVGGDRVATRPDFLPARLATSPKLAHDKGLGALLWGGFVVLVVVVAGAVHLMLRKRQPTSC
ncbi:MAG: glycosyltransferase family 39 protein [Planctomycetes bacterium]|nr:glycosyltransferase family 39 protein [Planctomycetota bacterium]